MKLAIALLALASPLAAQTLTLMPAACGSTAYVNCNNVHVAEGGTVWLSFPANNMHGFIQFTDADGVTGTSLGHGTYSATLALTDPHTLHVTGLSFIDTEGAAHTGSADITYHFYLARGSGRGGGGGGWKLMLDGGTITLQ